MSRMPSRAATAIAITATLFSIPSALDAQNGATAPSPKWSLAPSLLPPGARIRVISGDPTLPGLSTIELWMPNGYRMPPHSHPMNESVEVKQGSLLIGMGDKFDAARTLALGVGDSGTAPAGMHHYSLAKGATIVAVTFEGPYIITYLNASDVPRQRPFPYTN